MIDRDTRLRAVRGIAKTETEAATIVFESLKEQGHPTMPPPRFPMAGAEIEKRWTAPTTMTDLVEEYPPLGDYQIHFEYLKIAENEFTLNRLLGFRNIVSTLFIAEAYYDPSTLEEVLLRLYDEEPDREAVYLFLTGSNNWQIMIELMKWPMVRWRRQFKVRRRSNVCY